MKRTFLFFLLLTCSVVAQPTMPFAMWKQTPTALALDTSGIQLWLDAIDSSTIIRDGSGYVSVWYDKSPYGRYYRQYNASKQPRFQPAGLNSRASVVFDGSNDVLVMQDSLRLFAPSTVYILQRTSNDAILFADSGSFNTQLRIGRGGVNILSSYDNATERLSDALSLPRTTPSVIVYRNGDDYMSFYQDTTAFGGGAQVPTKWFGFKHFASAYTGANNLAAGGISAVLVFNSAHSDLRRQQTVQYLKQRWGL